MLLWLQVYAENHKGDCGSYKDRIRFIRLALMAKGVG